MDLQNEMEEIYRANAKIVYHFLYSRCRDEKTAEDLTQETFLQAYQSIDRFDQSCKLSTWLCQIAKHLWLRHLEKQKKEVLSETAIDESAAADEVTEHKVFAKIELMDVLQDMQELPPLTREVIYLRISGDLSFREIGEILGRSENWARVTFYRGKEFLLKKRND